MTLTPPSAEGRLRITLKLLPQDTVISGGIAKPLRDCTLDELQKFADEIETEIDELYRQQKIGELLEQSDVEIAIDSEDDDWLDQIVVLDAPAADAPQPATAEVVEIEELAPRDESGINISAAEPVYEERNNGDPTAVMRDPQPQTRTAGMLPHPAHSNSNSVVILLDEVPFRLMQGHARSSLKREVAGFMLGPLPEKQPDGRYLVHITDMIAAKHTHMSGASVTYTPESWRDAHDRIEELYPAGDHIMVGWYHTHPGFGIFLSNMDLSIHMGFFTQKWHIAYVLDPVGFRSGFFSWDRRQQQVISYNFPWPRWARYSW